MRRWHILYGGCAILLLITVAACVRWDLLAMTWFWLLVVMPVLAVLPFLIVLRFDRVNFRPQAIALVISFIVTLLGASLAVVQSNYQGDQEGRERLNDAIETVLIELREAYSPFLATSASRHEVGQEDFPILTSFVASPQTIHFLGKRLTAELAKAAIQMRRNNATMIRTSGPTEPATSSAYQDEIRYTYMRLCTLHRDYVIHKSFEDRVPARADRRSLSLWGPDSGRSYACACNDPASEISAEDSGRDCGKDRPP